MASWTDGPEYAPVERPDVFVEPDAVPLADTLPDAAAAALSSAGAPGTAWAPPAPGSGWAHEPVGDEPPVFEPVLDAVPLDVLAPPQGPQRDPHEAFDVVSTPLTTWGTPAAASAPAPQPRAPVPTAPHGVPHAPGTPAPSAPPPGPVGSSSAWGAAHAAPYASPQPGADWAPEQPFPAAPLPPPTHYPAPSHEWPPPQVNPADFPPPEGGPWWPAAGVPSGPPAPTGPQPVSLDRVIAGVTPGVLITLGVGLLIGPLSGILYFAAWVLASRVRYRRALIARLFSVGAFGMLGIGFVTMWLEYGYFDLLVWFDASVIWAQLANLVVGVASILIVRNAIVRGEPPEPAAGR